MEKRKLEIELVDNGEMLLFQYVEHPFEKKLWKRKCKPEDGFRTFERFIRMKKWFLEYQEAT